MTPFALIATGFLATPLVFLISRQKLVALAALLPAVLFCGFASYLPDVASGQVVVQEVSWIPSLGISMTFRLDGLALLFAMLITGIGTLIFLYASAYLHHGWRTPRFFSALTVFMASMLGAVVSDDLLALIVFWELTSLSSFMLIGHEPEKTEARRSAQQGLLITVGGGLAMLAGAVLLGSAAGTYRISEIIASTATNPLTGATASAIVILIGIGAFSKSAQAPLHSWLANAMVAPTPVSAYLHSATMVKLGVYLMARLNPALSSAPLWTPLLVTIGTLTMITGVILAIRHRDLKRILAYSTVVSLGTLITLIGMGHPIAAFAMVVFLLVHALYKAALFMVAGIIDHATGTRDTAILGGLAARMPTTLIAACLAGLSMAGLPPLLGFMGKELIYEAALLSNMSLIVMVVAIGANACMVAIAAVIALRCFVGRPQAELQETVQAATEPSIRMWMGPLILAALGLVFGLLPGLIQPFLVQAAAAVQGESLPYTLSLWHGITPMLALSAVTLVAGAVLFFNWDLVQRTLNRLSPLDRWGPDALYDRALDGLMGFAEWQTRHIQTGSLRYYMSVSMGLVSTAVVLTMWLSDGAVMPTLDLDGVGLEVVLPFLLVGASIMVLRSRSIVQGIISAGAVGFGVAVVFLLDGAPDLAFTQFSVEALSVVILLAIIGHMPFRAPDPRPAGQRVRDAVVATAFGLMFAVVLFGVVAIPFDEALSDFFRAASVPQAHGRNLVNVIIVDFRALDALGEITVLALAALAAVTVFYSGQHIVTRRNNGAPAPATARTATDAL